MHLLCFAEEGVDKEEPQEGETDVPSPDPKKVAEASHLVHGMLQDGLLLLELQVCVCVCVCA